MVVPGIAASVGRVGLRQGRLGLLAGPVPRRHPAPIQLYTVFEVHGHDEVQRASYGPVAPHDWQPCKDHAQTVEVDLVVIGFGFVPNTELTELAGCRHQFIHELGGWVPCGPMGDISPVGPCS